MEKSRMNLPKRPETLCFDKDEFMKVLPGDCALRAEADGLSSFPSGASSRCWPRTPRISPRRDLAAFAHIAGITAMLQQSLEGLLLEGLQTSRVNIIRHCLRTYATIDKTRDAEGLVGQVFVKLFREIAESLEAALTDVLEDAPSNILRVTQAIVKTWSSLQRCWSDKMFLPLLTHCLWKLTLQILARYSIFVKEHHYLLGTFVISLLSKKFLYSSPHNKHM
ncbi:unnamed protein product [Rangifer tarandus platyrhynchus]|uniref:COG complex component COG2 C-terminal domain-containing protein n=1 Tax=Rangifer tarandus platyrhynchus TaxID=3082113 RepID=A0ABN8YEN6_RANTA|nr:unnamed protein product [Rangifer tarandus platyrhynchus]